MRTIVTLIYAALATVSYGQDYYDEDGSRVDKEKSLYYTVTPPRFRNVDTIRSYYTTSGTLYSITVVNEAGLRRGNYIRYHENGNVMLETSFDHEVPERIEKTFYADGHPQKEEVITNDKSKLVNYWDSLGNKIIDNGNGYCVCVANILQGHKFIEKGNMINRVRDSIWIGEQPDGTKYFEEHYAKGKLISGKSFKEDSDSVFTYTEVMKIAMPQGGMEQVYNHVNKSLTGKYPVQARRLGVEGRVFVQFIVERSGELSNVRVLKGIGAGCDEVALEAVQSLPPWNPGLVRGQPERQKMVLPIVFKLTGGRKKKKQ